MSNRSSWRNCSATHRGYLEELCNFFFSPLQQNYSLDAMPAHWDIWQARGWQISVVLFHLFPCSGLFFPTQGCGFQFSAQSTFPEDTWYGHKSIVKAQCVTKLSKNTHIFYSPSLPSAVSWGCDVPLQQHRSILSQTAFCLLNYHSFISYPSSLSTGREQERGTIPVRKCCALQSMDRSFTVGNRATCALGTSQLSHCDVSTVTLHCELQSKLATEKRSC